MVGGHGRSDRFPSCRLACFSSQTILRTRKQKALAPGCSSDEISFLLAILLWLPRQCLQDQLRSCVAGNLSNLGRCDFAVDRQAQGRFVFRAWPPNLHPKEAQKTATVEMAWDMTIDRMPGQADEYNTLPL